MPKQRRLYNIFIYKSLAWKVVRQMRTCRATGAGPVLCGKFFTNMLVSLMYDVMMPLRAHLSASACSLVSCSLLLVLCKLLWFAAHLSVGEWHMHSSQMVVLSSINFHSLELWTWNGHDHLNCMCKDQVFFLYWASITFEV